MVPLLATVELLLDDEDVVSMIDVDADVVGRLAGGGMVTGRVPNPNSSISGGIYNNA